MSRGGRGGGRGGGRRGGPGLPWGDDPSMKADSKPVELFPGMILVVNATNIGSDSLPVGADISGLMPRYINIIIASATTLLTFLGSYTVFLMPICGAMVVDYWLIRRGNVHVPNLYTVAAGSPYYHGWNLRAVAAWVAVVAFTVHGIAGALDADSVNQNSKKMYKLGFLLSLAMGSFVYYVLCLIWSPLVYPQVVPSSESAADLMRFEHMAASEGFFPSESYDDIKDVLPVVIDVDGDVLPARGDKKSLDKEFGTETYSV